MNKKKLASSVTAVAAAAVILLGSTYAWQSVEQTALNEASDVVNPGGRLHDDFDGENKDIYVENFADEPIFARIQLSEFMAVTNNKGNAEVETVNVIIGKEDETTGERFYDIHYFHQANKADSYWTWDTGGSTVYMPTFNKNKDSLVADVNGTYLGLDGIVTDDPDDDRYSDHVTYTLGDTKTGTEIYDSDSNDVDEVKSDFKNLNDHINSGYIVTLDNSEHTAGATLYGSLISMKDWLDMVESEENGYNADTHGTFWVYDSDGWVYWSGAIMPGTATGLLLDGIELTEVMDDSWYYAIQVKAQFVTADDIGKDDGSGFYDTNGGSEPTPEAERLLSMITGETLSN